MTNFKRLIPKCEWGFYINRDQWFNVYNKKTCSNYCKIIVWGGKPRDLFVYNYMEIILLTEIISSRRCETFISYLLLQNIDVYIYWVNFLIL